MPALSRVDWGFSSERDCWCLVGWPFFRELQAIAGVAANELGCTIFSSALDGTNEVAFSCAQLGLAPGDDVDALVVLGVGDDARTLLFSVTPASVGAAASGVALQAGEAAADVFASDGTGDNLLYIEERALGLLADDDLDALAIETASDPGGTWLPPPPEDLTRSRLGFLPGVDDVAKQPVPFVPGLVPECTRTCWRGTTKCGPDKRLAS